MRIRGIVFDMDGVLLLSSGIHAEAFRQVLAKFEIGPFEYRDIAGMRTDDALRFVLTNHGISATEADISRLAARKSDLARKMIADRHPVAPFCRELIPVLAARYALALASSASAPSVEWFLETTRLRGCFSCVLSGADVQNAKPAPDIYTLAFAGLKMDPRECLVIEDAVSGVAAATAAGAPVWGLSGTSGADELLLAGASRVLSSLEELYELAEPAEMPECR